MVYNFSELPVQGYFFPFQNCFDFPTDLGYDVSDEAKDLMRQLICSSEYRLGKNGIKDFQVMFTLTNLI